MKVTIEVNKQMFEDMMSDCNSNYWCTTQRDDSGDVEVTDRDTKEVYKLTKENRIEGLVLMAKLCPRQFASFLSGQFDANTGDVWLQCAVLGEIKYG